LHILAHSPGDFEIFTLTPPSWWGGVICVGSPPRWPPLGHPHYSTLSLLACVKYVHLYLSSIIPAPTSSFKAVLCGLCLVLLPGSPPRWPTSPGWLSGHICSPPRWSVLHPRWELKLYILAQSLGGFQNLTLTSSPSGGVVSFCWLTATVALPWASSLFHP